MILWKVLVVSYLAVGESRRGLRSVRQGGARRPLGCLKASGNSQPHCEANVMLTAAILAFIALFLVGAAAAIREADHE